MPVESKIIPAQESEHKWRYPALGVSKGGGHFYIVLFNKSGDGTCIYRVGQAMKGHEGGCHVGAHMTAWDMKLFEPWHGSVAIESASA